MRNILAIGNIDSVSAQIQQLQIDVHTLFLENDERDYLLDKYQEENKKLYRAINQITEENRALRGCIVDLINDNQFNRRIGEILLCSSKQYEEKIRNLENKNKILSGLVASISKACVNGFRSLNENRKIRDEDIAKLERAFSRLTI